MGDESHANLEAAIEQEEIRLRERLAKIGEFKRLARELSIPLGSTGVTTPSQAPVAQFFDGTIVSLVNAYKADPESPYHKLKPKVRNNYDGTLSRIVDDIGYETVAEQTAERINRLFAGWCEGGKLALAHSLVAKLRLLSGYGATALNDPACILFASLMRTLRFKTPTARVEQLTADHAKALRTKAHEVKWHSIALAQAIQFELKLRPIDVIGEWVDMSDATPSSVTWGNEKWVRGLRWSDIDDKMVLRFSIIDRMKRKNPFQVDLTELQMVREELDLLGEIPTTGPLIICEANGRPYSAAEFRRKWRIVASKAGVPDHIRNGDSIRAEPKGQGATKVRLVTNTAG